MANWLDEGLAVPTVCFALLLGGLVVDLTTDQALVVAIIYAIPIALSGTRTSTTLTWWCIGLAMLANVAAGYDNVATFGFVDGTAVLNRGLAALSFVLVGVMTLLLESTSEEVDLLVEVEQEGERQRRVREFMVDLSGPLEPEELMDRAVGQLRELLGADAVVAVALEGHGFAEPRWADPPSTDLATPGTTASWAVDALPINDRPVIAVRSDQGMMSVGRWRCASQGDLIVLAARPDRRHAASVLGDALSVLDPIRERAHELANARAALGERDSPGPVAPEDRPSEQRPSSHDPDDGAPDDPDHGDTVSMSHDQAQEPEPVE